VWELHGQVRVVKARKNTPSTFKAPRRGGFFAHFFSRLKKWVAEGNNTKINQQ